LKIFQNAKSLYIKKIKYFYKLTIVAKKLRDFTRKSSRYLTIKGILKIEVNKYDIS